MFRKKKTKKHCKCIFWGVGEKLQTVSVADVSLLNGTSSTLSQLLEHGGSVELFEKCGFNRIVLRQTRAISTLHSRPTHKTLTNTHIHTH